MPANLENSAVATGLEKSVSIPIPNKDNAKECSNYSTTAPISHTSKLMLKILQARLQQYVNRKRQRNKKSNCQHLLDHRKSKRVPEKHLLCFIDYAKAFDCVDHNKLWKILKEMGIPDHLIYLLRNLYAGQEATVRTGHETANWFKIGKVK